MNDIEIREKNKNKNKNISVSRVNEWEKKRELIYINIIHIVKCVNYFIHKKKLIVDVFLLLLLNCVCISICLSIYPSIWHSDDNIWHDKASALLFFSSNKRITDVVSRHHHPHVLLLASCLASVCMRMHTTKCFLTN
jgi:hypothetical protein